MDNLPATHTPLHPIYNLVSMHILHGTLFAHNGYSCCHKFFGIPRMSSMSCPVKVWLLRTRGKGEAKIDNLTFTRDRSRSMLKTGQPFINYCVISEVKQRQAKFVTSCYLFHVVNGVSFWSLRVASGVNGHDFLFGYNFP